MDSYLHLENSRLAVDIAKPGAEYRGSRFDWSGFVTQVVLNGTHTFLTAEPTGGSGGVGLSNEFGTSEALGYDETAPGKQFPKIGVGLITRPDTEPYNFYRPYTVTPFPTTTVISNQTVEFTQEPLPCLGYAARLVKRISLADNELRISYLLENTGEKPIHTDEYCHNFLLLDGHLLGPGYELKVPALLQPIHASPVMQVCENAVTWEETPQQEFLYRTEALQAECGQRWELRCGNVSMSERTDRPWDKLGLWGGSRMVSPEAFIRIEAEPGGTMAWNRIYSFSETA